MTVLSVRPYHPAAGCGSDTGDKAVQVRLSNPSGKTIRSSFSLVQFAVLTPDGTPALPVQAAPGQPHCGWQGAFSLGPHASVDETLLFQVPYPGTVAKVVAVSSGANGQGDRVTWTVPKEGS